MILFPAIDLKDGNCVRLIQGDMDQATVFNDDPGAQAAEFEALGFEYLHLVDLNGAFAGKPVNGDAVRSILANISIPAQLGGGIRDLATIEMWLETGMSRVILGTAAVRDPDLVREACKRSFRAELRSVLTLGAAGSPLKVGPRRRTSRLPKLPPGSRTPASPRSSIPTSTGTGCSRGLNLEATKALSAGTSIPVIASGGLSSIDDIAALLEPDCANIEGAISGRALYDGRLDAAEALALIAARKSAGPSPE